MGKDSQGSDKKQRRAAGPVTGYLAPEGLEHYVKAEAGRVVGEHGRLILGAGAPRESAWAQNIWFEPVTLQIESISDGAKQLRAMQRNWAMLPGPFHRRSSLIQEQLPHVSAKPLRFPTAPPSAPLGSWTLIEKDTIVAAPRCSSPFPNGIPQFLERKSGPPSRAYLKLWEVFTLMGYVPEAPARCLDLGASPGGWSWALAELGLDVIAIDRAPLDPALEKNRKIKSLQRNAFSVKPLELGELDWVFSDVICYPEKLLEFIVAWMREIPEQSFVCTLKFQGTADPKTIARFKAIPGSTVIHLSQNKHELTWVRKGKDAAVQRLTADTEQP